MINFLSPKLTENCWNIKASKPPVVRNSSLSSFSLAPITKLLSFYYLFSCFGVFNCFIRQGLCLIFCSSDSIITQSQEVCFSEYTNFGWWICSLGLRPATRSCCLWCQLWIRTISLDKIIVLLGSRSEKGGCLKSNVIFATGRMFKCL